MYKLTKGKLSLFVFVPFTLFSFLLLEANFFIIKDHLPGFRISSESLRYNINVPASDFLPDKASVSRAYVTLYMLNTLDIEANKLSKQSAPASIITIPVSSDAGVWDYSSSIVLKLTPILKTRTQVLLI